MPFVQQPGGEQRGPCRHRELEREHRGERQHREAQRPGILRRRNARCCAAVAAPSGAAAPAAAAPAASATSCRAMMTSASTLRIARISKMLSPCVANPRIDTAMTENESRAPTIQRTTRASLFLSTSNSLCGRAAEMRRWSSRRRAGASLRVRLIFRPRLVEGGKLERRRRRPRRSWETPRAAP